MLAPSLIQRSEDWVGIATPTVLPSTDGAAGVSVGAAGVAGAAGVSAGAEGAAGVSAGFSAGASLEHAPMDSIIAPARIIARIFFIRNLSFFILHILVLPLRVITILIIILLFIFCQQIVLKCVPFCVQYTYKLFVLHLFPTDKFYFYGDYTQPF